MMKKILALLLTLVMALSLFAGCTNGSETPTDEATEPPVQETTPPEETETPAPAVEPEEVPEAKYHWSFDDATGLTAVKQVEKAADSLNDGAIFDIGESDHDILFAEGPVGQCLYLDGKYGVKLDLASLDTDAYTISFWINADRLSAFGPTVQVGRNIGAADTGDRTVTWLNVTKSTWGTANADIFPVVWNRNSETGVWPWVYAADDAVHGKREWTLVTIVASGEKYACAEDGLERIGCKFYLDGKLAFDASAELGLYGGLAPEILTGDGIEGYIGVNYWDTIFKGFIDELCIFDTALTDGQVLSMYLAGNPAVESVAPDYEYEEDASAEQPVAPPVDPLPDVPTDTEAIETVGTPDLTTGWWGDWSGSYEVANGSRVKIQMNNYSSGVENWNNYVAVFCANEIEAHNDPLNLGAEYREYAAVRSDAFGWGADYNAEYEMSWEDWEQFKQVMVDAEVTLDITQKRRRAGSDSYHRGR